MTTQAMTTEETRLAEEIVSVLPADSIVRVCSDDRQSIRFAIRAASMKLRTVVLHRSSLRRLLADAARAVKIEYLKRDLLRNAASAGEFRYPRNIRRHAPAPPSRLVSAI
jgi:hypothetical protein